MFWTYLKLGFRNIRKQKRRSFLTLIGIVIGIAAVIALVSLGQGFEQSVAEEFQGLGADKIFINPGQGIIQTGGPSTEGLTERDIEVVERVPSVLLAGGMTFETATATYRGDQASIRVIGLSTDESQGMLMEANSFIIDGGRTIRDTDRSSIVAGYRVQETLFDRSVELRSQIEINDLRYTVTGTLERTGDPEYDRGVLLPLDRAQEITGLGDNVQYIIAQIGSGFEPQEAKEEIEDELRQHKNVEEGEEPFTVSTTEDVLNALSNILSVVQAIVLGIASISLLVGGIGIMNTMYTSVSQRTNEIGVMKAIGATDRQILALFVTESAIIGLVGGLIGTSIGYGISIGAGRLITATAALPISVSVSPGLVAGAMGFSMITGVLSGILPARKAAKMEPVDALRYE
ncbi:MAG: ABC transporter permease [Candidatus Nanohaloarchaeota archaeon QJJ-5]|nr:ABC transporter permease [Candidatus Nanohaloarchaeota archaeon QJJ-5]